MQATAYCLSRRRLNVRNGWKGDGDRLTRKLAATLQKSLTGPARCCVTGLCGLTSDLSEIEQKLLLLVRGQHGSISLKFNEEAAWNFASAADMVARSPETFDKDWVSDELRELALATNCVWSLQWYPDTPERYRRLRGGSLVAVIDAAVKLMMGEAPSIRN